MGRVVPADPLGSIRPAVRVDDRLTVRHRLDDGSATDVVGWVTFVDDDTVGLQPAAPDGDGAVVTVHRDRIILARRVPPARGGRPPARVSAEELELAALPGWLADDEPLGRWTLRFGNGFTGRANSCLAVGDPGIPYADAAAMIIERYTAAGLPPWVQVITGSEPDRRLQQLGWRPTYVPTTVMAIPLTELIGDHRRSGRVTIGSGLTEAWWQSYLRYRPVPDHGTARRILTGRPPVGLAAVPAADGDHRIVALGRGQVTRDWLGIAGLWTDPAHRRRGLATMIIRDLAHWSARHGARSAYLQVAQENAGAIEAYRRLGFVRHHDYRYLAAPTD